MIKYPVIKIVCILLYSVFICTQLTGCENENAHVPGDINGPRLVSGPVEDITRSGTLNIEKSVSDGYYADGEFISGNEAYYVVIRQEVLIKSGIKLDEENGYVGKHTVVITSQDKVLLEPHHAVIYEIKSLKTP